MMSIEGWDVISRYAGYAEWVLLSKEDVDVATGA
jgi:hypothetical protein